MEYSENKENKYASYIKESYNREYRENEFGFITWQVKDGNCIINTLYIEPEHRAGGKGSELADIAAKESGCKTLLCEIDVRSATYLEAFKAITKYGFKPLDLYGTYLVLSKELE